MEALKSKGLELYAAYGNTTTDIRAYTAAGIPKVGLTLLQVSHLLIKNSTLFAAPLDNQFICCIETMH
jgi:hypothetical protein